MSEETRKSPDAEIPAEAASVDLAALRAEKAKRKRKERIDTLIFMVLVTFFFISGVSLTYLFTRDTVKRNQALFLCRAVFQAAGVTLPEGAEALEKLYRERVVDVTDETGKLLYCKVRDGKGTATQAWVLPLSGPGLWGPIEVVVGFNADRTALTGLDVLSNNETPGLGGRITETWFTEQFRGKMGPFTTVAEGEVDGKNQFDAITGASITSKAMVKILNRAIEEAPKRLKQKGEG